MKEHEMIWSTLLHVGTNMWRDKDAPVLPDDKYLPPVTGTRWCDEAHFDLDVFHKIVAHLPEFGINTLLLDIGDGVQYDSHPEIGVKGALTPDELRAEVRALRALGIEPVPKLNFSAGHDAWLGEYERMLSTDIYRTVVGDLIHEICDIFGGMLLEGSTSFWETTKGELDFSNAGSLCHGWAAVACYVLDKYYGQK